jgi:hypothetical protein
MTISSQKNTNRAYCHVARIHLRFDSSDSTPKNKEHVAFQDRELILEYEVQTTHAY